MTRYRISRDYPPPKPIARYPFEELQVGESFLIPKRRGVEPRKVAQRVSTAKRSFEKVTKGYRFTCRVVVDGVRVWRIPVGPEVRG